MTRPTRAHADSRSPRIAALLIEGFRTSDIARHLGCASANVSQVAARYTIARPANPTPARLRALLELDGAQRRAFLTACAEDTATTPDYLGHYLAARPSPPPATPTALRTAPTVAHPDGLRDPICLQCAATAALVAAPNGKMPLPIRATCPNCHATRADTYPLAAWTMPLRAQCATP